MTVAVQTVKIFAEQILRCSSERADHVRMDQEIFWKVKWAIRTVANFFWTDDGSRSNGCQFFLNGWLKPFEQIKRFYERMSPAVRTDANFFWTDDQSRLNGWNFFWTADKWLVNSVHFRVRGHKCFSKQTQTSSLRYMYPGLNHSKSLAAQFLPNCMCVADSFFVHHSLH